VCFRFFMSGRRYSTNFSPLFRSVMSLRNKPDVAGSTRVIDLFLWALGFGLLASCPIDMSSLLRDTVFQRLFV